MKDRFAQMGKVRIIFLVVTLLLVPVTPILAIVMNSPGTGYTFLCAGALLLIAFSIYFYDELFQLGMMFKVKDADRLDLKPSEMQLMGAYINWGFTDIIMTVFGIIIALGK